jgi:nitroimidazol reductase NimA-like FMN-containing flavoprotein (pyridoxamine 5'-phosphate oxidase superfamily)
MLGISDMQQIELLLHSEIIGRIGCHDLNSTYIVPISYAYDGKYIYCHTHEGKKVDMMRRNPRVCFEVDHLENMANWQSVIAWGTFEELKDAAGRSKALQHLHERIYPMVSSETVRLSPEWPFPPGELNRIKGISFRILLEEKTGRYEKTT